LNVLDDGILPLRLEGKGREERRVEKDRKEGDVRNLPRRLSLLSLLSWAS